MNCRDRDAIAAAAAEIVAGLPPLTAEARAHITTLLTPWATPTADRSPADTSTTEDAA